MNRRTLLRGAAGTAALATVGGCARTGGPTQVVVVWSGYEFDQFRSVLDEYRRERNQPVDAISAGDDIDELLRARRKAGTHPHVAILPRLGLIADFAQRGWLVPLDRATFAPRFPAAWNDLVTFHGQLFGAWVKFAHKSLLWTRPSILDGGSAPKSFDGLVDLVRRLATRPPRPRGEQRTPAPLAVGAADGWVLTDWFENVLASLASHEEYQRLAQPGANWDTPAVRHALSRLAELWSIPGALPGGGSRALLTQYEESVIQVVRSNRAAIVFEGDFVSSTVRRFQRPGDEPVRWYRFPAAEPGGVQPFVVSGDAAVVLRDSPAAHDLVEWLTNRAVWPAFGPWLQGGGYLTPNLTVPDDAFRDEMALALVQQVRTADRLQFDLSDQLTGRLAGGDGSVTWRILQDFFAEVTRPAPDIAAAVRRVVRRFTAAARTLEPA